MDRAALGSTLKVASVRFSVCVCHNVTFREKAILEKSPVLQVHVHPFDSEY